MNLLTLTILLLRIVVGVLSAGTSPLWAASYYESLESVISDPLYRSQLPQFILDARHPWILANQVKLERLPNVTEFLCCETASLLDGVQNENADQEDLTPPADLFDYLEIDNNRVGISRPGWPNARERLKEIRACPRALQQVKSIIVEIYIHSGDEVGSLSFLEPAQPPAELLRLFGDVLSSLPHLDTLKWNLPKGDTHYFEAAFKERKLSLSSVKRLEVGPSSHYLVGACGSLEELRSWDSFVWGHGQRSDGLDWRRLFIEAAGEAERLRVFEMGSGRDGWTPELISDVVKYIPQIEHLGLLGEIGHPKGYTGINTGESGKLKELLTLLRPLKSLKSLTLPDSSSLNVGFNGGPGCGNVYDGAEGEMYLREIVREGAKATEVAGVIVGESLPRLESFSLGGEVPEIERDGEGNIVGVKWPWMGRMEEWSLEVVPETPAELWELEYSEM